MLPRLAAVEPSPGRMQLVTLPGGAWLLRDEAKSPLETVDACLDVLDQVPVPRRLVVMGRIDGAQGGQATQYQALGCRIGRMASRVLFYDSDDGASFRTGLRQGGLAPENFNHCMQDIGKVIKILQKEVRSGDVVLIKGSSRQRLERVALALMGQKVRCDLPQCHAHAMYCAQCSLLSKGWQGRPPIT